MCPLDRVLTYKNLIYLLNLQFYCVNTSYPMDNSRITTAWMAGALLGTKEVELILEIMTISSVLTA